jgi:hypothetical protein
VLKHNNQPNIESPLLLCIVVFNPINNRP